MFSNSMCLGLIEILDESAAMEISAVFKTGEYADCGRGF